MKFALLVSFAIFLAAIDISVQQPFEECIKEFMPEWIPENADIDAMQALDSSWSVAWAGFQKGKKAARKVNRAIKQLSANGITGDLSGSRSGFIQFASLGNTDIKLHLPDFSNKPALNAAIGALVYSGGMTAIAKALQLAGQEFDANSNAKRNKRVMLITDGYETQSGDPENEADILKYDYDAEICVITIGDDQQLDLLKKVASKYNHKYCICHTDTWGKLYKGMIKALKLLQPVIKQRRKNRRMQLKQSV